MSLDLTLKNREFKFNVSASPKNTVFEFEDFRLDVASKLLYKGGDQVVLTPKAVETLIAIVESRGEVVGKDDLIKKIWGDTIVEESNLAQYLHILRKTLGETPDGKPYIETLKRRGYRFNGAVRVVSDGRSSEVVISSAENRTQPAASHPNIANFTPRRAETRGSYPALTQVAAARETRHPQEGERPDNIYSVADWRRELNTDTQSPAASVVRSKWLSPMVLAFLLVGFAGIILAGYNIATTEQGGARGISFAGADITRLTTSGKSKRVAISPDGKYVAHVVGDPDGESLWVRQTAIPNDTRIAGPSDSELVWVTFAPDGDFVYYLALERDKGEAELFRVPVLGGPTVKVAQDVGAPTFSPDGTKLAYMITNQKETRLIVSSVDGAIEAIQASRQAPDFLKPNEVVLVSRNEPDYLNMYWYAPAWSLDGKSIAFPVNQSDENGRYETVMAVDIETRVERRLTSERWQQVGQPRWLADGLVVSASETSTGPNQLWHIALADGTASRITRDLNSYQNLSFAADAGNLAVVQRHVVSNIWTLGGDATNAKQLRSEAGWLNELIWLPDGRLAYTSSAGGSSDIWTMNSDGSGVRQLTVGANARLGLTVTPDEKQLIFAAERDGKYNLWRIGIDGSKLTRVTNGEGELYPQCTPDGRWIVYQSGGNYPTIWKMPIGGGEPVAITTTTGSRPSISPDGKFVAYHYLDSSFEGSRWGIGVSRVDDGTRVKRFDFPSTVVERIVKWTPDGKSIAFMNSPGGVPNIWTQPIDGGEPRPMTNFPSDSIISFNWNADGTQLAVIRGVETSDVVLINGSMSK